MQLSTLHTMQPNRTDNGLASWHEARQIIKIQEWNANKNYRRVGMALLVSPLVALAVWLITKM